MIEPQPVLQIVKFERSIVILKIPAKEKKKVILKKMNMRFLKEKYHAALPPKIQIL